MTNDPQEDGLLVANSSYAQQRIWLMEQLQQDTSVYNIRMGLRLTGRLDRAALDRALREVLRRHETLRTCLEVEDGELVQLIDPDADLALQTTDLSAAADPETAWQQIAESELRRPFDTATELPVRANLLRLADDEHVLVLTLAHSACDAWSLRVLHGDLVALYQAFAAGQPSPLADLPIQYADYAAWQRCWLANGEQDRQLEYWRAALGDAPRLAPLPTVHPGGRPAGHRSAAHTLPPELVDDLTALARQHGASLFSALLAGFGVLLSRYAGQHDFVVGSLMAGRTRPEIEGLVGFFVNTVGLRLRLHDTLSFREFLGRVHGVTLDAHAHQDVPFERVIEELDLPTGQSLFDVMFQLADLTRDTVRSADLTLAPVPMASRPAPADLVVAVLLEEGKHTCVWDHRDDMFSPAVVARMQEHLVNVLRHAVREPDLPVSVLELASAAERSLVTGGWDGPARPERPWCLPCQVGRYARTQPDATAVHADGGHMSYAELDRRANRLAHHLRAKGVGPETLVGVCLDRGVAQLVSLLAVLRAGAAFLPLDPTYPAERLAYMVHDARPVLTLTGAATRDCLDGCDVPLVVVDGLDLSDRPDTAPRCHCDPDHLAYVIYTSGSTGRPKGTALPRRGLALVADAQRSLLGIDGTDRVLRFASFSFDASVFEVVMAWAAGGALYVPPEGDAATVELAGFVAQHALTAAVLPPSALSALIGDVPLPTLQKVMVAGEACPPALAAQWSTGRAFFNLYGPTEATIWSTAHRVDGPMAGPVPIGRLLPGLRGRVLTATGRVAPVGVPGELHVGGPVLARGYLGRPGLTAERFVPDPFGTGERLYRTGDLVRYSPDGELEFLGRIDDQVKIRGFRVEIGEVEARLGAHPSVRDVAVVVHEEAGDPCLVGYVTGAVSTTDEAALRDWCGAQLPSWMVPARVVPLDRLPTSGSGKVDRAALAARAMAPPPTTEDTSPASPLEQAIGEIWAEVLGGRQMVGTQGNFFDLGGNSLSATRVIIRLRSEFQVEVPIRTLFDRPVLADFTATFRELALAER